MKLLNPIYDASFKYLMQDTRAARFFLSILLDKDIEVESFQPQEITLRNEERNTGFSTPRMDFIATIIEEDGRKRKVLIELQQCFYKNDITRFRSYLGRNYMTQDTSNNQKQDLEIIAIYILGFKLNIPVAVVKTSTQLIDASTKQPLEAKTDDEEFIRQLHHESIFIDTTKLSNKLQNRIDRLLAIFNPQYRDKHKPTITLPDEIAQNLKQLNTKKEQENIIIKKLEDALCDEEILYAIDQQEKFMDGLKYEKMSAEKKEGKKDN